MAPPQTTVTFLGTSTVVPTARHDTASFMINGKYLVDTGWYATIKMLEYGFNPMELEYLFITHYPSRPLHRLAASAVLPAHASSRTS